MSKYRARLGSRKYYKRCLFLHAWEFKPTGAIQPECHFRKWPAYDEVALVLRYQEKLRAKVQAMISYEGSWIGVIDEE